MPISASAVGSFSALGGEVITISWLPGHTPNDAAQAVLRVAGYLDRIEKPLLASKKIARDEMEQRFDTETDPDGKPWEALSEDYLARKLAEGYPATILTRTGGAGSLRAAATRDAAFFITGHELWYNAANLPHGGLAHQDGSVRSKPFGAELKRWAAAGGHELAKGAGENVLPARPFIGIGGDAEAAIFDVFDMWFAGTLPVWIRPGGYVQSRAPSGQFGPLV